MPVWHLVYSHGTPKQPSTKGKGLFCRLTTKVSGQEPTDSVWKRRKKTEKREHEKNGENEYRTNKPTNKSVSELSIQGLPPFNQRPRASKKQTKPWQGCKKRHGNCRGSNDFRLGSEPDQCANGLTDVTFFQLFSFWPNPAGRLLRSFAFCAHNLRHDGSCRRRRV